MQQFVQVLVLKEIAEDKERHQMRKEERDSPVGSSQPVGLGIADALQRKRLAAQQQLEAAQQQAQQPQQVVVNVGAANSSIPGTSATSDLLVGLAAFVLKGPDYDRPSRMRTAALVLAANTSSKEERLALAQKLDAAVEAKKAEARTRAPGFFDRISSLLKGP